MKTCGECFHFEMLGEGKDGNGKPAVVGNCFGLPPQITVSGMSSSPIVPLDRRECHFFKLPPKGKTK